MKYFGTDLEQAGHYLWELHGDRLEYIGLRIDFLPFHPEQITRNMNKGDVAYYTGGGFTAIAITGSCADDRAGCKSVFILNEKLSFDEMKSRIIQQPVAKEIIDKMPFKVRW